MTSAETTPADRRAVNDMAARPHVSISGAEDRLTGIRRPWLLDHVGEAMAALATTGEVRVRIVDDAAMAAAHVRYSGVAGTTDVLTFDLADGEAETTKELDVDLLICLDEAMRQSSVRGHAVERELLLYILHGVLHCLGYDDHDEREALEMHAEEDRILLAIGVGATFAREERDDSGRKTA